MNSVTSAPMRVLVLNCGSSSLKYKLLVIEGEVAEGGHQVVLAGKRERLETADDRAQAVQAVVDEARSLGAVDAVGHRVVHGGERFRNPALIDDEVRSAIEACVPLAPLHNPANLAGVDAAREALECPQVAVFDTAFHAGLPRRARSYAIDPEVAEAHHIRRFGFHGTSHAYVTRQAARHLGQPLDQLRIISCHLGNGASACAVECGRSVETSMGLTPLEGLVMGTRSGDIDPGAILALLDAGLSREDVDDLLNHKSGLAGLSGAGNDLRDIEARAAEGDERARLAIGVFAHRVRKYIGAYAAVMGGVDAVVLTGGIGQNSAQMRRRILQRFDWMGLIFDEDENAQVALEGPGAVAEISQAHTRVRALVVATDEEGFIAEQAAEVVRGMHRVGDRLTLPIAVSARHVHLDDETFAKLFGAGASLVEYKPLSQPGQFASEQRVDLVGPRGRIDGVRLLGPLRSRNQIEISRTDEFSLGVDAPVRMSGHTAGSAPITLEGPAGRVQLPEGLICAWRHVHMTPDDAERFGVKHGDSVEVAITGGDRDLIFGDVIVRVSEKYATEMHIDTDEANAAELAPRSEGMLVEVPEVEAVLQARRPRPT